jgi:hypothetical protein
MLVPISLNLVIVISVIVIISVIVPMFVCFHDLMVGRTLIGALIGGAMIVRPILRAHQRGGQTAHRKSRQSEQCRFQKVLHGLSLFLSLKRPC